MPKSSHYSWSSVESTDFVPTKEEVLNGRYQIIAQLGSGAYSAVWKCADLQNPPKEVALKIHKCDNESTRAAKLEYAIISHIQHPNIVAATDAFVHYDAEPTSRKYFCVAYELCDGDLEQYYLATNAAAESAVAESTKNADVMANTTTKNADAIVAQLLSGLAELHSHKLMHLDIKPENIMVIAPSQNTNSAPPIFKLADFSAIEFTYAADSGIVGTRYYRAPEILLGLPHTPACDIWAMGCILFELCTGDILFEPHQYRNFCITRDEDHLAQMIELVGPLPQWMLVGPRRKLFLRKNGHPRHIKKLCIWPIARVMCERYKITDLALIDLLQNLLAPDPNQRPTAEQCIAHPWFNLARIKK